MQIKRVCGYGRVSTKHEEQESSLQTQREMFNRWIEAHKKEGYKLVNEVYEQKSGTLVTKRPKFLQMLEEAKQGYYDTLLFKDSKRFSRNAEDFLSLVEDLKLHNINIIFITEGLDSSKEKDRTMLSILGMMAENYSNALHNNLQNSLKIKFESELGRVPGDVYGYKRVKGNSSLAEIVPDQAEIIKELFTRYADGEGIASIAEDFINRDIRNYRGNRMSMYGLRRYIRNPIYKGVLIMNKMQTVNVRTTKRVRNDESLWIVRDRPDLQIVDAELWDRCNEIMDANKRKLDENTNNKIGSKPNILTNKLFSKVVVCGCCGRNYNRKESHHSNKEARYTYLMCNYKKYSKKNQANLKICTNNNVIRIEYLIKIVSDVIMQILNSEDSLEELVSNKITNILKEKQKDKSVCDIETKLKEARDKQKRVAMLYKDGLVDEDEYLDIRKKVKNLESLLKNSKVKQISEKDIHNLTEKFIDNMRVIISENIVDEGGVDVKQFNKLFKRIVINDDSIDIEFRALNGQIGQIDINEIYKDKVEVFVPCIDNDFSGCKTMGQINKRIKRHEKAKYTSSRESRFIQLNSNIFDGKLTNQVIIGSKRMDLNIYLY